MSGRPWTARDDARLRSIYPDMPTAQVAKLLRRSVGTVYVRASTLGITKASAGRKRALKAVAARRTGWKTAEVTLLKKLYPTVPAKEIAAQLGIRVSRVLAKANTLGLHKDPETIRRLAREATLRPDHGSRPHRFAKGHVPANKGIKGWQAGGRAVATQFKPGQKPHTTKPLASVSIRDEFVVVKVNDAGYGPIDWKPLHRLLWERLHGPVPDGHIVIFADGNRRNFADDNLKCITLADNCRRNSIHNLPAPLKETIFQLGRLNRRIRREKQNRRSA